MNHNRNTFRYQSNAASNDIKGAMLSSRLWLHLGWSDIQQRYRGSILGPLWITLSMIVFVVALSIVYSRLFHQDIKTFMPFLTTGMLCWSFISTVLIESTDVFVNSKSFIDNIKLPYLIYILRLVWRNHIVFFHNLIVFVAVALFFKLQLSLNTLLFFPAFILVSALLTCISVVIALLGTRFRDVPPVISSLIMVVFFISPVTWHADMIGANSLIIRLNPLYYILDVMRSPLLGIAPAIDSWIICLGMFGVFFTFSFILYSKYRSRIPFWI